MKTWNAMDITQGKVKQAASAREVARLESRICRALLIVLDLALTFLAFRAAYMIRFSLDLPFFKDSVIPNVPAYVNLMMYAVPVYIVIFLMMGLYHKQNLFGGTVEYAQIFNGTTFGMFLIIAIGFLLPEQLILARGWVVMTWILSLSFLMIGRFAARRVVYAARRRGRMQEPAVIVGANHEGLLLVDQFMESKSASIRIIGYIDDAPMPEMSSRIKRLGGIQDLDAVLEKYGVGEIILTGSALSQEQVLDLFRRYGTDKDINLRMSSGLYQIITTGMQVKEDGMVPLLTINKVRMTGPDQILKLLLDFTIALAAIILLLPVFAVTAILIRLDSPGPIIYRRRVMGVNGREFDAFKFRTMRIDGDRLLEENPELMQEYLANYKLKNDPRVTRVGAFLRKVSLDELPQLFNVLRNEMSIVGPRMICPDELEKYDQFDINLMTVKPGITGLWQVRGRSDVSYEERVPMDMYYIRNWTIWLDLQLLVQTIPAVLSRRGAY